MWQKIKNLSSRFSNFLYKNKGSVYTGCVLVIIFTVLSMTRSWLWRMYFKCRDMNNEWTLK